MTHDVSTTRGIQEWWRDEFGPTIYGGRFGGVPRGIDTDSAGWLPAHVESLHDLVKIIAPFDAPLLDAIGDPDGGWADRPGDVLLSDAVAADPDAVAVHGASKELDYRIITQLRLHLQCLEEHVVARLKPKGVSAPFGLGWQQVKILCGEADSPNAVIVGRAMASRLSDFPSYASVPVCYRQVVDVLVVAGRPLLIVLSRQASYDAFIPINTKSIVVRPVSGKSFHSVRASRLEATVSGEYVVEVKETTNDA